MRRIKVTCLLAPATIYQHAARTAEGYKPSENSRFAVVRCGDAPWELVHIRSGGKVNSLIPQHVRRPTMTDLLGVAAAFDAATHLDWRAFDALPEIRPGAKGYPSFSSDLPPPPQAELRALACQALGVAMAA